MLTFYTIPVSLYCAKLRILLRHKQLQWQELLPPGGYGSDDYKLIVASGNLPAMVEEQAEGSKVIADSEAIAEFLNEKYATFPMLPKDKFQRAKIRELSRFHDTRLEPELRKLFPHIYPDNRNPEVAERQSENISLRLRQLATMLAEADHSGGGDLSLADCGLPISFCWIDALTPILNLAIEWPDAVSQYRDRLGQQPAVQGELEDYAPKVVSYLKAPGHHET